MQYEVIEGQEGVTFPFPDNHIILSKTTSQEDLKTVFEHPLGPGFVGLVFEPHESASEVAQPLELAVDPATEPLVVAEPVATETEAVAEPKTAKKGAKA